MNTSKNNFLTRKLTTHLLLPFIGITGGFLSSCSTDFSGKVRPSIVTSPTVKETQNQSSRPLTPTADTNSM
ncbi:hypothetical protein [Nostoc sp. CALU 1950]|uniref:hypothetical protein n=1 Tax=Nostoc sp. CALU 1950 TaxID=3104321 RepID=UPI003EC02466